MTCDRPRYAIIALLTLVLGAAGCLNVLAPQPDQTHFFILDRAASNPPASASASPRSAIGLGPIDFPQYLARAEMVTRTAPHGVEVSARNRWAEPLDLTFKRVLSEDLSSAMGGAHVIVFPWFGDPAQFAWRIQITVDRFETDQTGAATLTASWSITHGDASTALYSSSSVITVPATPGDPTAAAAALSEATGQFADQLATAVRRLQSK